jgi:hypothetical protein
MVEKYGILKSANEQLEQSSKEEVQRLKDEIKDFKDDRRVQAQRTIDSENVKPPSSLFIRSNEETKVSEPKSAKERCKKSVGLQCEFYSIDAFYINQTDKILKMIDSYSAENHIKLHKYY